MRLFPSLPWCAAAAAILICATLIEDAYTQYVLNLVLASVVVAIGLNIVLGFAGLLSFAHSAFMGIGAYATAIFMERLQLPFVLALPLAGFVSAAIGVCVGLPAVRVRGLYLALVTIACLYFFAWIFVHWAAVTNGSNGMNVPAPSFFGMALESDGKKFYLLLPIAALMLWLAAILMKSKLGRAFVMVRDAELAAQTCGINVMKTRALAFGISAFYAGVGGGMFAVSVSFIDPHSFGMLQMVTQFGMVLIGGLSSLTGSLIGAVLLTILPEFLREFRGAEEILYGLLMIVFIIFMPDGIAGFLRRRGWIRATDLGGRRNGVRQRAGSPAKPASGQIDIQTDMKKWVSK
jgi:branched-chain amino acid transport system permease protein